MLSECLWLWVHKNLGLASGWLREPRVRNSAFPSSINMTPKNLLGNSALPTILTHRYCHRFPAIPTLLDSQQKGGQMASSVDPYRRLPIGIKFHDVRPPCSYAQLSPGSTYCNPQPTVREAATSWASQVDKAQLLRAPNNARIMIRPQDFSDFFMFEFYIKKICAA